MFVDKYIKIKADFPKRGIRSIANELDVPKTCLYEWVQWVEQNSFIDETASTNKKYRLEGGGRNSNTIDLEEVLIKWISAQRRLDIGITTSEVIYKLIELDPSQNKRSFHALQLWCYKFLKRYSYGIPSITPVGLKIKEYSKTEYKEFYNKLYNLRFKIGDAENMDNLFNMDEIPIMFEMVGKTTIAKIGERNINIRKFKSERTRISVILCISASGIKLPPLLIFNVKKRGYIEEELKKNPNVKNNKIYVLCQENSWADADIFMFWIQNIFFNNIHVKDSLEKILILDRATTHYDPSFVAFFKKNNSHFLLIPPGITRFIQPLDVSINGTFKKAMYHWDTDFRINNLNTRKPKIDEIINAVVNLWYNNDLISKENIITSFKYTGISVKLDGSEQHLVKKYDEVCDEIILPSKVI